MVQLKTGTRCQCTKLLIKTERRRESSGEVAYKTIRKYVCDNLIMIQYKIHPFIGLLQMSINLNLSNQFKWTMHQTFRPLTRTMIYRIFKMHTVIRDQTYCWSFWTSRTNERSHCAFLELKDGVGKEQSDCMDPQCTSKFNIFKQITFNNLNQQRFMNLQSKFKFEQ